MLFSPCANTKFRLTVRLLAVLSLFFFKPTFAGNSDRHTLSEVIGALPSAQGGTLAIAPVRTEHPYLRVDTASVISEVRRQAQEAGIDDRILTELELATLYESTGLPPDPDIYTGSYLASLKAGGVTHVLFLAFNHDNGSIQRVIRVFDLLESSFGQTRVEDFSWAEVYAPSWLTVTSCSQTVNAVMCYIEVSSDKLPSTVKIVDDGSGRVADAVLYNASPVSAGGSRRIAVLPFSARKVNSVSLMAAFDDGQIPVNYIYRNIEVD